jgi:hypothetical protein
VLEALTCPAGLLLGVVLPVSRPPGGRDQNTGITVG